jgi:hypothetical protein
MFFFLVRMCGDSDSYIYVTHEFFQNMNAVRTIVILLYKKGIQSFRYV